MVDRGDGDAGAVRPARVIAVLLALSLVTACGGGPADYLPVGGPSVAGGQTPLAGVDREALRKDLEETASRVAAAGSSAGAAAGSVGTLSAEAARQAQAARRLIAETGASNRAASADPGVPAAAGPADPRVIPGGVPILCADGQPVAADGRCPSITDLPKL